MRRMHKYLLFFLVAAFALPFLPIWPGGKPLMTWKAPPGLSTPPLPDVSKMKDMLPGDSSPSPGEGAPAMKKRIYKYRDSSGKLVFSDTKPPEGVSYTTVATNTPTNVIPTPKPIAPPSREGRGSRSASSAGVDTSYSPERVQQLVQDSQNVEKLLQDRKSAMDNALDGR